MLGPVFPASWFIADLSPASVALFLAAPEHGGEKLLLSVFLIFASAKLLAEICQRFRQPALVGEILAGVFIGPGLLGWVEPTQATTALAELGVMFLLFNVGLEVKPRELFEVGGTATAVAVLGVIVPFIAGLLLAKAWHLNTYEAIFIGAGMVATSVGITARVLQSLGHLQTRMARVIIGAAVVDDILGLIVLAFVSSMAGGAVQYAQIFTTAGLAIGFTAFLAFVGLRAMRRLVPLVHRLHLEHALFIFALVLTFGLSYLATFIGVAAIIGAFMAGLMLSEYGRETELPHQFRAIGELMMPFFFVDIGMKVTGQAFTESSTLLFVVLLIVLAALTKVIGCGLGALRLGWREATLIGVGMIPRGEVGIVVAQLGLGMQVLSGATYSSLVAMALVTTLIAPPILQRMLGVTRPQPVEDPL